jgi:SAM-dependent methyltransferase
MFPWLFCLIVFLANAANAQHARWPPEDRITYVASHSDTVHDMLWLAEVGPEDIVYDLGSGDGRICIAAVRGFDAKRAVGIELDPALVAEARQKAKEAGVEDRVAFIEGDLFEADFSEATVVALYLGLGPNLRLRPKLFRSLKPGARVVSHQFGMGEWRPDKILNVRRRYMNMYGTIVTGHTHDRDTPPYRGYEVEHFLGDGVMAWVIPEPLAGKWHLMIDYEDETREYLVRVRQRFSDLYVDFDVMVGKDTEERIVAEMWGDQLRFQFGQYGWVHQGIVDGDEMCGYAGLGSKETYRERPWHGIRLEPEEICGTWEWKRKSDGAPILLRIDCTGSQPVATYIEDDLEYPISDFYQWGSGFYWTLQLWGRHGEGGLPIPRSATSFPMLEGRSNQGYLIGCMIVDGDHLRGSLNFHSAVAGCAVSRFSWPSVEDGEGPRRLEESPSNAP